MNVANTLFIALLASPSLTFAKDEYVVVPSGCSSGYFSVTLPGHAVTPQAYLNHWECADINTTALTLPDFVSPDSQVAISYTKQVLPPSLTTTGETGPERFSFVVDYAGYAKGTVVLTFKLIESDGQEIKENRQVWHVTIQ